jgi:hypothetical protein
MGGQAIKDVCKPVINSPILFFSISFHLVFLPFFLDPRVLTIYEKFLRSSGFLGVYNPEDSLQVLGKLVFLLYYFMFF